MLTGKSSASELAKEKGSMPESIFWRLSWRAARQDDVGWEKEELS